MPSVPGNHEMNETFIDNERGVEHEIAGNTERVPIRIWVRCGAEVPPQFGPSNIGAGPVTCLACIGWVERAYATRCQYCGKVTGSTPYPWATEDVCFDCAVQLPEDNGEAT